MIKNNIVKGFSWLVFGSLVSKALGGFYKIFLTRIIGGENLGIFNQILSIYTFFVLFVSAGLPTAMSKLIAKYDSLEHKVKCLKSVLKIFIYISIFISICLVVVSFYLSHYKGNLTIQSCYFILAPAIVFSSMTAIIKGYFQAENNFKPSAISQIVEQLIKIIIGLLFCYLFKSFGAYVQILIAVFAIASADFAIFLILYFSFKKHINFKIKGKLELKVLKQLFNIVFPIMLASLILPFSQMIDSLLVVKLLSRNFSVDASIYLYGLQSGVVATLINLPTVVTFALSSVLMPLLTRDYEKGNMEGYNKKITLAVKIIISFAVPCVIFVLFYPDKIINLLYKNKLSGYGINGEMLTSKLLFWSAMNILFLCGSQFLSICLQAQDKKYLPAFNNLMGVIIKFILEIVFIPSIKINILAYTLASTIGYFVIFALNVYEILKSCEIKIDKRFWTKLCFINIVVISFSLLFMLINDSAIGFLITIIFSVVIYIVLIFILKLFKKSEINLIIKNNSINN